MPVIAIACSSAAPTPLLTPSPGVPTAGPPPFVDLPELLDSSDLVVLADITEVSEAKMTRGAEDREFWSYDVVARVEQTLRGPDASAVEVRVPYYEIVDDGVVPTKAPPLSLAERAVLFLSHHESSIEPGEDSLYVTTGGGVTWGTFPVDGTMVQSNGGVDASAPLDDVVRWIAAH